MIYVNLINGRNELDVFNQLSRPANDEHYNNYERIQRDRGSRMNSRINAQFRILTSFKALYKTRHPRFRELIDFIYEPFLRRTVSETIDAFGTVERRSGYHDSLIKASMLMREIYGLNLINLSYDFLDTNSTVRVSYDVNRESVETFSSDRLDPLAFAIGPTGYPDFKFPDNVIMNVFISTGFMKSIFMYAHEYLIVKTGSHDVSVDSVMNVVSKVFNMEIKNGIIVALYKDRYRELMISQIFALYNIIHDEISSGGSGLISANEMLNKCNTFYRKIVEDFRLRSPNFDTYGPATIQNLITSCPSNPVEVSTFYSSVIDLGPKEIDLIRKKLDLWEIYANVNYYADVDYLNKPKGYEFSDLNRSVMLLNRLVPFVYFTECIIGPGSKINELNRFAKRLSDYLNNSVVPIAARYHRFHRNSLSYQIDKAKDTINFYKKVSFKNISRRSLMAIVVGPRNAAVADSAESWNLIKTDLLGTTLKDYMIEIDSYSKDAPEDWSIQKAISRATQVHDKLMNGKYIKYANEKQHHKAPCNIDKMFDLVRKGFFSYVGYDPCHNILLSSTRDESSAYIESPDVNRNEDALKQLRQNAISVYRHLTRDQLLNDDMRTNEYAVIGNVMFIGNPGTPFAKCCFVYNRKNGNLVLDDVNKGHFFNVNDSGYREIFEFYMTEKDFNYNLIPYVLNVYLDAWKSGLFDGHTENYEDVIMTDSDYDEIINRKPSCQNA